MTHNGMVPFKFIGFTTPDVLDGDCTLQRWRLQTAYYKDGDCRLHIIKMETADCTLQRWRLQTAHYKDGDCRLHITKPVNNFLFLFCLIFKFCPQQFFSQIFLIYDRSLGREKLHIKMQVLYFRIL